MSFSIGNIAETDQNAESTLALSKVTNVLTALTSSAKMQDIPYLLTKLQNWEVFTFHDGDLINRIHYMDDLLTYLRTASSIGLDLGSIADYFVDPGSELTEVDAWPDDRVVSALEYAGYSVSSDDSASDIMSRLNEIFSGEEGSLEFACPDGTVMVFRFNPDPENGCTLHVYKRVLSADEQEATDILILQVLQNKEERKHFLVGQLPESFTLTSNPVIGFCDQMTAISRVQEFLQELEQSSKIKGSLTIQHIKDVAGKYGNTGTIKEFLNSLIGVESLSCSSLIDAISRFINRNSGSADDGVWKPYDSPGFCSDVFAAVGSILSDVVMTALPIVLMAVSRVAGAIAFFAGSLISALTNKLPAASARVLRASETPTWNVPLTPAIDGVSIDPITGRYLGDVFDTYPVAAFPIFDAYKPYDTTVGYIVLWPQSSRNDPANPGHTIVYKAHCQLLLAAFCDPEMPAGEVIGPTYFLTWRTSGSGILSTFDWMHLNHYVDGQSSASPTTYGSSAYSYTAGFADDDIARKCFVNALGSVFSRMSGPRSYSGTHFESSGTDLWSIVNPADIWSSTSTSAVGADSFGLIYRSGLAFKYWMQAGVHAMQHIGIKNELEIGWEKADEYRSRLWWAVGSACIRGSCADGSTPSWTNIHDYMLKPMWEFEDWRAVMEDWLNVDALDRTCGLPSLYTVPVHDYVPDDQLYEAHNVYTPGTLDIMSPAVEYPAASLAAYVRAAMAIFAASAVIAFAAYRVRVAVQQRAVTKLAFREAEFEQAKRDLLANPNDASIRKSFYKANRRLSRAWKRAGAAGVSAYNGFSTESSGPIFSQGDVTSIPSIIGGYLEDSPDKSSDATNLMVYLASLISGQTS